MNLLQAAVGFIFFVMLGALLAFPWWYLLYTRGF